MTENPALSPAERLASCRQRIDAIDEQITQLLLDRTGIIREVGELKAVHWPGSCHIRPAREGQMHEAITARFTGTDIPPIAALAIWRQMIGAATTLESPLSVVSLVHQPHHAWLAREYFGAGVGNHTEQSLVEMLDTVAQGTANIVLLPASGDWWRDAGLFAHHGLSIFATLPVSTLPLPQGATPALALAAVQPEPSGNDISYLALTTNAPIDAAELQAILPCQVQSADATHHLLMLDGFVTEGASETTTLARGLGQRLLSLTGLGTHPKPVSL